MSWIFQWLKSLGVDMSWIFQWLKSLGVEVSCSNTLLSIYYIAELTSFVSFCCLNVQMCLRVLLKQDALLFDVVVLSLFKIRTEVNRNTCVK